MKQLLLILFLLFTAGAYSQTDDSDEFVLPAKIIEGDTVPLLVLEEVTITPPTVVTAPLPIQNNRLVIDVKKVYPYAVIAGVKLKEANDIIAQAKTEADKKKKLKQVEDDMKKQFTKDIENMTYSQGKILLKLIYRQTGSTSYDLVKELRGSFRAVFYQTLARLVGANLKIDYNPTGEDKAIEDIVVKIENGTL